MKITIITVCYNAEKTIEKTILSVAQQTHESKEHIVVDGASTDHTLQIIKRYPQYIAQYVSEPDAGIYDAMNKGIHLARGEILAFLNSDDYYDNPNILKQVAQIFANNKIDACYGDLVYVDPNKSNQLSRYWRAGKYKPGAFSKGWSPPHPTFFVKKMVYNLFGGFDLNYTMGNDIELMMRFLEKKRISVQYIPSVLVRMQTGGVSNQSFRNIITQNRQILKAAKQLQIPVCLTKFILYKIVNRFNQFWRKPKIYR